MLPGGSVRQLVEGTLYEVRDTLQTKRLGVLFSRLGTGFLRLYLQNTRGWFFVSNPFFRYDMNAWKHGFLKLPFFELFFPTWSSCMISFFLGWSWLKLVLGLKGMYSLYLYVALQVFSSSSLLLCGAFSKKMVRIFGLKNLPSAKWFSRPIHHSICN